MVPLMLSTLFALLCLGCAYYCTLQARDAASEAQSLRLMKGRIIAAEHSLEVIETRMRKALGAMYTRTSRERAAEAEDDVHVELPLGTQRDPELQAMIEMQSAPAAGPR